MEDVILLQENGIKDFLESINYGSNLIRFEDLQTELSLFMYADVINEIVGGNSIRVVFDNEDEEGKIYSVIWADKDNFPPSISEEELSLPEIAERALNEKIAIQLNINPKLKNYAKKISANNGIRLTSSGGEMFFNGMNRKPSVFTLIQQAYNKGERFIEFDSKEVQAQTVRIYASQFNTFMGTKFSVSANKDKIRIQFAPPTPQEQAVELFKKSVLALMSAGVINDNEAGEIAGIVIKPSNEFSQMCEVIKKTWEGKEFKDTTEAVKHMLEVPDVVYNHKRDVQPLLLKEDGQFKIPETKEEEEEEEEEAIAGGIVHYEPEQEEDIDEDF